uniref:Uncharacterized protein n=1 Tax=Moniliophthora roreri TaxID=221103 RepID=A0A0W0ET90_MONRR
MCTSQFAEMEKIHAESDKAPQQQHPMLFDSHTHMMAPSSSGNSLTVADSRRDRGNIDNACADAARSLQVLINQAKETEVTRSQLADKNRTLEGRVPFFEREVNNQRRTISRLEREKFAEQMEKYAQQERCRSIDAELQQVKVAYAKEKNTADHWHGQASEKEAELWKASILGRFLVIEFVGDEYPWD